MMKCLAFGYAGSSDNAFSALASAWPDTLPLKQFVYPGRGSRQSEVFSTSLSQLAHEAVAILTDDEPVMLLGYSMGALVAFEAARQLQRQQRRVAALVVCAINAPHQQLPSRNVPTFDLPALTSYLAELGGTPPEILASQELMAWFAPAIQSDYRLLDGGIAPGADRLDCPIIALSGQEDVLTTSAGMQAWRDCTSASFQSAVLPGGHFFLQQHPDALISTLFTLFPLSTVREIS